MLHGWDDMPKIYLRHIDVFSEIERAKLRLQLNALGFYVLTVADGLDVYAVCERYYWEKEVLDFLEGSDIL
jgi:hypothetical protein